MENKKYNSMLDIVEKYKKSPLTISALFDEQGVSDFLTILAKAVKISAEKNSEFGFISIAKNEKYDYFYIDYGTLCFALERHAENFLNNAGVDKIDKEIFVNKIGTDFALQSDIKDKDELLRNSLFFISLLEYYGVAFKNKNRYAYSRTLFKNEQTGTYTIMNAVGINAKDLEIIVGKHMFYEYFVATHSLFDHKVVATGNYIIPNFAIEPLLYKKFQ